VQMIARELKPAQVADGRHWLHGRCILS
jgi:hypothetical protein